MPLSGSLFAQRMGVLVDADSPVAKAYSTAKAAEEYDCNFRLNPNHEARLHDGG